METPEPYWFRAVQGFVRNDHLVVGFALDVCGGEFHLPSFTFNDFCQQNADLK